MNSLLSAGADRKPDRTELRHKDVKLETQWRHLRFLDTMLFIDLRTTNIPSAISASSFFFLILTKVTVHLHGFQRACAEGVVVNKHR